MVQPEAIYTSLRSGDRRVLSRCISWAESQREVDQAAIRDILDLDTSDDSRPTKRIAISGVPGVGKSTFINALGCRLAHKHEKVAVLAVDPSSSLSGGSILGDKTRMAELDSLENVFIRPSPTHGALGGVTAATRTAIQLCEIAGYETILIETVGVGQSEHAVSSMTDMFITLLLHNAGDDIQALKRGIMELTDVFLLHKVDDEAATKAAGPARGLLQSSINVLRPAHSFWKPTIGLCSSTTGFGMDEVENTIAEFFRKARQTGGLQENRKRQRIDWTKDEVQRIVAFAIEKQFSEHGTVERIKQHIRDGKHPLHIAKQLSLDVVQHF